MSDSGLVKVGNHVGALVPDRLITADGVAEGDTIFGVVDGHVERGVGETDELHSLGEAGSGKGGIDRVERGAPLPQPGPCSASVSASGVE